MPEKHALLSPSSAARWLNCPPSARLCAEIEDKVSSYAEEGTLAHSICEVKLTSFATPVPKRTTAAKLNKLKKNELYRPEMDGYTNEYVDYIKKIALGFSSKAHIAAERQVDYSAYVPEGFGTADCIILHGEELHIIDFKYGKGVPVSAEDNPQLKLYALGALNLYGMLYPVKNITLHIVQPRLGNYSEWRTSLSELTAWGESIRPTAQLAYKGKGEFHSGEHCRFCKISATCRKRSEDNLALAKYEFRKPSEFSKDGEPTLSDDEIGCVLTLGQQLKKWYDDIEKYALAMILAGRKYNGWKAVEGRGSRFFTNADSVPERLGALGYSPDIAYERKMLTPPQLEKIIGKNEFAESFGDLVEKSKGKPTLVPLTDSRPDYVSGTTAVQDFKEEN